MIQGGSGTSFLRELSCWRIGESHLHLNFVRKTTCGECSFTTKLFMRDHRGFLECEGHLVIE